MEDFPKIVESTQLPLALPRHLYLNDHCFDGRAVLPAVEAMEILAQAARRIHPGSDVTAMTGIKFDKFLTLTPQTVQIQASCDLSLYENGDMKAVLTTRTESKMAALTRIKAHATVIFPQQEQVMPNLPLDMAASLEGVTFSIRNQEIYPDLIPFGPSYRNVANVHVAAQGAIAEIRTPVDNPVAEGARRLGSPFALDAAFHAACVWGQRFAGIIAFPVAMDQRRIFAHTRSGETYYAHVLPVRADSGQLIFDLRIYDRAGCLYEACSGVRMRDVSGGKLKPPQWVRATGENQWATRIAARCDALTMIELASLAPFADQTLAVGEETRLKNMSGPRRRSYLAARLACKRLSRILSDHDTQTDPRLITTVCEDRPRPCCPLTDGSCPYSCSVSHDDRFVVAAAGGARLGVDVEKMSGRLLKSRRLYMGDQEERLVRESPLGEIEAAVRIWSIKEAVTKALDITLADAWTRVRVKMVGAIESRFQIDDQDPSTAIHDVLGEHVFTLVIKLSDSPDFEPAAGGSLF
jgi:phosphopantetheinyl transferase